MDHLPPTPAKSAQSLRMKWLRIGLPTWIGRRIDRSVRKAADFLSGLCLIQVSGLCLMWRMSGLDICQVPGLG
jgi:hypothetical protein